MLNRTDTETKRYVRLQRKCPESPLRLLPASQLARKSFKGSRGLRLATPGVVESALAGQQTAEAIRSTHRRVRSGTPPFPITLLSSAFAGNATVFVSPATIVALISCVSRLLRVTAAPEASARRQSSCTADDVDGALRRLHLPIRCDRQRRLQCVTSAPRARDVMACLVSRGDDSFVRLLLCCAVPVHIV